MKNRDLGIPAAAKPWMIRTVTLSALIVTVTLLCGCCLSISDLTSEPPDTTVYTEPPDTAAPTAPEETEAPEVTSKYRPGTYTTDGYSSQWLDLSFRAEWPLELTEDNLEINTVYNQALRNNSAYNTFEEMAYYWSGTNDQALTIYVTPLQKTSTALEDLIADEWQSIVSSYREVSQSEIGQKLSIKSILEQDKTEEISYLGNAYTLQAYQVVIYHGTEFFDHLYYWNLYRVVDDHLIRIQFSRDYSQNWDLDFFLSLFTSYDGTMKYEKEASSAMPETTQNGVFNVLSFSDVWTAKYFYKGYFYSIYLVFQEDGTCYYGLGDATQLWAAGKGTYSTSGYSIRISITSNSKNYNGSYDFSPDSNTLTQTSFSGITGDTAKGTEFKLEAESNKGVETVINWGNTYAYSDPLAYE